MIKNIWYSFIFLFIMTHMSYALSDTAMYQDYAGAGGNPTFSDMFKDATPEDLKMQAQMGQEMLANMSPEELAEMNQIMEEMIKGMSPEELDELMKMAEVIDQQMTPEERKALEEQFMPKAPAVEEKVEVKVEQPKVEPKKQQAIYAQEVTAVQKLAKEITQLVKAIVQKTKTKKSLEEFMHSQWKDKEEFDLFVTDITRLQDEKIATAFVQAMSKESLIKDLFEELQTFKKEVSTFNDQLQVTDTFGTEDHKESAKHMTILQKITSFFSGAVRNIKVSLSKFFSLHVKDSQETAKQHDEKNKKAKEFETTNAKGRPAAPNTAQSPYGSTSGYNNLYNNSAAGYNPDMYGSDYYYPQGGPSDYNPYEQQYQPRSSSNKANASSEKSSEKGANQNPLIAPQPTKQTGNKLSLDLLTEELDDFLHTYDKTHTNVFTQANENYPDLTTNDPKNITADQKQARMEEFEKTLDSKLSDSEKEKKRVAFKKKLEEGKMVDAAASAQSFDQYHQQVSPTIKTPTDEMTDMHKMLGKLSHKVGQISPQDAAKLKNSDQMKEVSSRLDEYETSFKNLLEKHTKQTDKNRKEVSGAGANTVELAGFDEATKKVEALFSSFDTLFEKAKKSYSGLMAKLDKQIAKKPVKKERPVFNKTARTKVAQEDEEESEYATA